MDLTALNATPIGAAARAVGRATFGAVNGVAGTLGNVRFQTRSSWSLLMNRTRYDYRSEVGDPATNSIVGAVVGWIARNFPEAPVRIVNEGTREIAYLPAATGPGAMLRLLERPNPYYSGVLQWMATIVDWVVNGNGYWFKVRVQSGAFKGRVVQLWWLPAHMVEPAWNVRRPEQFITHYVYKVDGIAYRIETADIVHFRNGLDPNNPRKGLSKLNSLLREIFTDDEASNFTASLMRNLGVPGVILAPSNTTGGSVVKAEPEVIKSKFKATFGGDNRGEPMVLSAPTDIKVLSWSPEQMNLTALRRIPEERISGVLGVPAMVAQLGAGLERSSFTNYSEANVAAYTQGVIPDHRLIAAELEVQLLSEFADPEGLDVWFDWTQVSAMQFAIAELWKRGEGAATKGLMTRAAWKQMVGLPVAEGDQVYVMPNNYVAVPVGGGNPPSPGSRATVTQVPRAALATTEPLLITAASDPEPVRCASCSKMLAQRSGDITGGSIAIKCPRCGELNEAA